jgi:hypothetical protein
MVFPLSPVEPSQPRDCIDLGRDSIQTFHNGYQRHLRHRDAQNLRRSTERRIKPFWYADVDS